MRIRYQRNLRGINWRELKAALVADRFDNGRTPAQLRRSFANSHSACVAYADNRIIGTARVLSDGICNAYLVDLWTLSEFRHRGIARRMVKILFTGLQGQHVYLQADKELVGFYRKLGFRPQPQGLSRVVGQWLRKL